MMEIGDIIAELEYPTFICFQVRDSATVSRAVHRGLQFASGKLCWHEHWIGKGG
jgi:hypothetical protein